MMKNKKNKALVLVMKILLTVFGIAAVTFMLTFLYIIFSADISDKFYLTYLNAGVICSFVSAGLAYLEYRVCLYDLCGHFSFSEIDSNTQAAFFSALNRIKDSDAKNNFANEYSSAINRIKKIEIINKINAYADDYQL